MNGARTSRVFTYFGVGVAGLLGLTGVAYADEAEHGLHAPNYPWSHEGVLSSYDHAAYVMCCTSVGKIILKYPCLLRYLLEYPFKFKKPLDYRLVFKTFLLQMVILVNIQDKQNLPRAYCIYLLGY